MKVTMIGTGLMGRPMAGRLLAAGHRLTVYNRTAEKAQPLVKRGASLAATAAEAIGACEAAVLMLKDGNAVRQVLFASDPRPDLAARTIIQMGTIGRSESITLAREVSAAGGDYLEAPVLGSRPQAESGSLLIMVGGTAEQFGRWRQLLSCFGPEPRLVGEVGQAAALKLALNQIIAAQITGFSLSLGLVRRRGLDPDLFMDILRQSALHAKTFDSKLPLLRARSFAAPNFPAALLLKDVDLVRAEASELGLETAVLDSIRSVVEKAVESGHADHDYSAVYDAIDPP